MAKFILSIDGGGIRGIIPALVLVELEKRLAKKGISKPLHQLFDLIAGTSTGGIIASGLAAPHPKDNTKAAATPAELVDLYANRGDEIFDKSIFAKLKKGFGDFFSDPRSLWQEKYDHQALVAILIDKLGNAKLSEGLTRIVMTAYDIENRGAVFMSNTKDSTGKKSDDFHFWQAARATSAAPVYFEPARVENLSEKDPKKRMLSLVDGGVFANDPSMAAYVEGMKMKWTASDIHVLSIGTGQTERPIPFSEAKNWGALGWLSPSNGTPIISVFMHGQASTASYQAEKILNEDQQRYFRINGKLSQGNDELDDASPANIAKLKLDAQDIIKENSKTLDAFVKALASNM